jgi:hypothetical protein
MNDMPKHELPDEDALRLLYEQVEWLEENIAMIDRQAAFNVQMHVEGRRSEEDIFEYLRDASERKQEFAFKLGEASVRIEQLQEVMREKARQQEEDDRNRETMTVLENHLGWLDVDIQPAPTPSEDGVWQEPERSRR